MSPTTPDYSVVIDPGPGPDKTVYNVIYRSEAMPEEKKDFSVADLVRKQPSKTRYMSLADWLTLPHFPKPLMFHEKLLAATAPVPPLAVRISAWVCLRFVVVELESSRGGMTFAVGADSLGAAFRAPSDPVSGKGANLALERAVIAHDPAGVLCGPPAPSEHDAMTTVTRHLRLALRAVPAPIPPQVKGKHFIFVAGRPVPWLTRELLRSFAVECGEEAAKRRRA